MGQKLFLFFVCFSKAIRYLFLQCNTALSLFTLQYNVIYLYSAIQRYLFLQCNTLSVFTMQYNFIAKGQYSCSKNDL